MKPNHVEAVKGVYVNAFFMLIISSLCTQGAAAHVVETLY